MLIPWFSQPLQQLWQLGQAGRLHHALLFTGTRGIGKGWLAQQLAERLLCHHPSIAPCGLCKSCLLMNAGHHPDFLKLTSDSSIGVDAVRDISLFFQQFSQQGGAKVVSIADAHKMTEAASNALLKTLEEPGQNCFLLLQTDHPDRLLPTILSRCQVWALPTPTTEQSLMFLQQQTQERLPEFALPLCSGAPLQVLDLWRQGQLPLMADGLVLLQQMLKQPALIATKLAKIEQLPMLNELIRLVLLQALATAAPEYQCAALERYQQWGRDCATILGQNKTVALAALLADLAKYMR